MAFLLVEGGCLFSFSFVYLFLHSLIAVGKSLIEQLMGTIYLGLQLESTGPCGRKLMTAEACDIPSASIPLLI